jgi:GntR family transcriptional regulator
MAAPLHLHVTPGDDVPIYRQIVRQVREAVASGRLRPGEQLESHRVLAHRLVISPLTVKKAYDELEHDGLVETARGIGTFVRRDVRPAPEPERREALRAAVRRLVHEAHLSDVAPDELLALVSEEANRLRATQAKAEEARA